MGVILDLGILGPLEIRLDGGAPLALGGLRQRALLAALILRANEVVSTDRLVDDLWEESPPSTAVHTVQVFVSRLRGALGPAGNRLVTRPPGYVLEVGVDEIDASRCERLYQRARSALATGDANRAEGLLEQIETLWRGQPLAEFTYEQFAQAAIARLEELRVSCREERFETELALGRHAEAISGLEALVREHPLRERPRGQLMLALYRAGRQADALAAFREARQMLVEELGVEPGADLRELEDAILRQEPSLAAPAQESAAERPPAHRSPVATSAPGAEIAPGQPTTTDEDATPVEDTAVGAPTTPAGGTAAVPGATPTTNASTGAEASPVQPGGTPTETTVRKTATVLAARLATAGPQDPEVAHRAFVRARDWADEIVARHGGAFVAGLAEALVWVFGLPRTKEDDALRALNAANELCSHAAAPVQPAVRNVVLRIGVATGEVVATPTGDLFGDPVGRAISLAAVAEDRQVLLGDVTRRLVGGAVVTEPLPERTAWRLLGLVPVTAAPQQAEAPMIGRDAELSIARGAFNHAASSSEAHLLTVLGEAGIGKSRLARELVGQLGRDAAVFKGRCLSYGEGIALWPMREALTQSAGGDAKAAIRRMVDGADDADVIADIVATALGIAPAEAVGEQVPWAFRRLFEELARRRPTMLVLEDAHWAEPQLLDLVDYLIDWVRAPILILCLGRPEVLDLRPGWGGGQARVSSLVLDRLGVDETRQLLSSRSGNRELNVTESAQIMRTAEGNPLFVEQLLQASAEDPWWDHEARIPATIQSLLAARLDRLGPGERAFIERAALIGREFWPGAVIELLPSQARPSASRHLRTLVHRGLIQPSESTLVDEEELRFHHILIRDVAYLGTPKALRSELHERFADWLVRRGERYDAFVGYHLEQAFNYRTELGPADAHAIGVARRAGDHFAAAGRRAQSRGDAPAGVRLLRSAADMHSAAGSERADVLLDLGSAMSESGDLGEAERVLNAALERSIETGVDAVGARASIELSALRSVVDSNARVEEVQAVAEHAIEVFAREHDEAGLSRAWVHLADVHWTRCCFADMEDVLDEALRHAERAGVRREESRILADLARAAVVGPRPANDAVQRCEAILERSGDDVYLASVAQTMLAVLAAMVGEAEEARERWAASSRQLEAVGLGAKVSQMQMYQALIELISDPPVDISTDLVGACQRLERIGDRSRLATTAALLARVLYRDERYEEADRYTALSAEATTSDDVVSQILWRGTRAQLAARAGDVSFAEDAATHAVALAEKTDFLLIHGAALRDRADVMTLLHRVEDATRDLDLALELYERKGVVSSAEITRRLRQSLADASPA